MTYSRYIVTGPDGSGKSTLVARLVKENPNLRVIYLGKNRTDGSVFNLSNRVRSRSARIPFLAYVTRMFFFIVELINLCLEERRTHDTFYIIERHFFDRIAYLFQLRLTSRTGLKRAVRYAIEWPVLVFLINAYARCFAARATVRIIQADPDVLFTRKMSDYVSLNDAQLRQRSYALAAEWWTSKGGKCTVLRNNSREDFETLVSQELDVVGGLQREFT